LKYKVKVNVIAQCCYTVEVEARDEETAEDLAAAAYRTALPDDFQVEKGYITDREIESIENLTWECGECEKEISYEESAKNDGNCNACVAAFEAEKKEGAQ